MQRSFAILGLVLCLIVVSGCQTVPFFSKYHFTEADSRHPLMEVLCVWEPAEGRGIDNSPCRGFGGQILCFASGYKEPVKVSGDVRIYLFDDQGVNGDTSLPIHQFDFTAEAWNTFLKPSSLGPSYQIFVPYTRKGMDAASCTLRVRLTPEGGLPVYSRMATVALAGQNSDRKQAVSKETVVTASHSEMSEQNQGITTADYSEMINSPESSARSMSPSKVPGISMDLHQSEGRQAQLMDSLRQASEEASRQTHTEPPQRFPETSSRSLKQFSPSVPSHSETEMSDPGSWPALNRGESRGSTTTSSSKRRHPLDDLDP